ncbi:MAG: ribbon-helix-helix protein, CopG family [Planctomycetota bacterium]
MRRSSGAERARRVNSAFALIRKHRSAAQAAARLTQRFSISRRQAYRYVEEAQSLEKALAIPRPKIAFTVKLPKDLIRVLRARARASGHTLSELVTQAVETFLGRGKGRG